MNDLQTLSKISEIRELKHEGEVNEALEAGWILLSVVSAAVTDGPDSFVVTKYVVGCPDRPVAAE